MRFIDTNVFMYAVGGPHPLRERARGLLFGAVEEGERLATSAEVLQELLQGFSGPRAREQIIERFSALPLLVPDRRDHIEAAELRNTCRRKGLQVGTVDALLAQLCVRHGLLMLTTDRDFHQAARLIGLRVWTPTTRRH